MEGTDNESDLIRIQNEFQIDEALDTPKANNLPNPRSPAVNIYIYIYIYIESSGLIQEYVY